MKRIAVYPGSFDPVTNGHLDVVERASRLFDEVIIAVAVNSDKHPLFSMEERKEMVIESVSHLKNIRVDGFEGLLVDYTQRQNACALVRGLRAVSDFEFEFQMALMNRQIAPKIETIFLMPKDTYTYLSSRIIKEIARLGGDISSFVPSHVHEAIKRKCAG
ncbi:pantetheine-phosphate adenylyltransferase [Kamptonema cortianum]|nr:pantetheine-phosphate adenylyltransferase [Kamptonema cortianum]MDL5044507.1 pantetheine-phosphate adenylyltransferase [Oscillatoria amoena NRMC-F 0135]